MQSSGTAMTDLPDLCRESPAGSGGLVVVDPSTVDKTKFSTTGVGNWSTTPSSKSLSSSVDKSSSEDDADEQCGWGPLQPRCCQVFRSPKVVLFFLCCLATIQGMVVNGFVSVVISTIERRFELSSKQSGFVASGYDIASVLCLIPVSYIGGRGHKPRWIAGGVLLLSLGSFMFALPHFVADFYSYDEVDDVLGPLAMCRTSVSPAIANASLSEPGCDNSGTLTKTSSLTVYMFVMVVAQMLHGAGATPIYTLAVTYLDDILKPKVTPLYLGIFYTTAIIGPAIGYIAGGKLLEIYCDVGSVDLDDIHLTPEDPQWVGAWWIGFLISGTLSFLIAVPISAFPKSIPASKQCAAADAAADGQISHSVSSTNPAFVFRVKDIPSALKSLLGNATFMSLNMAGACESLLVSGFVVFAPKFVESQFGITAAWAAQLIGFATIPSGGGGTLFGGLLVKQLNLQCKGILRLCLVTTGTVLLLTLTLLARCENVPFAGINVDYILPNRTLTLVNLTGVCNANCHCVPDVFEPVCGADNLIYFSPCYAGCHNTSADRKMHYNCECVTEATESMALAGRCNGECQLLSMFLVIFALIIFVTFTTSMPALAATLRCVPEQHRSFALGIQWILFRTLGMIPAPVLFGFLIDYACVSWHQATCNGDKGACLVYDNWAMGTYLLVLVFACKSLSFGFFILAICLYRSRHVHTTINVVTIPESMTYGTVTGSELQPLAIDEQGKQESEKT